VEDKCFGNSCMEKLLRENNAAGQGRICPLGEDVTTQEELDGSCPGLHLLYLGISYLFMIIGVVSTSREVRDYPTTNEEVEERVVFGPSSFPSSTRKTV